MEKKMKISFDKGLEARPAAMLVQIASMYDSKVCVETEGKTVNAKSGMGMMSLTLNHGEELTVRTEGADEADAIAHIERFINGQGA